MTVSFESRIEDLASAIERQVDGNGAHATAIEPLSLFRRTEPTDWAPALYEPALFFLARGSKEVQVGETIYRYDPAQYVLTSVDLPLLCRVCSASEASPYLGLRLRLDPLIVAELLSQSPPARSEVSAAPGWTLTPLEPLLLDAAIRLVRLLERPQDIAVMAPLILREICYRILMGPQGQRLQQTAASGAPSERIARAISWIREHATQALRIDEVARKAGMGVSTFHQHFKTVTGMSPLQFQKRLRLMESRRLLISAGVTAAEAAHQVGYASPSQFSRDYRRLFGAAPKGDVVAIRSELPSSSM